MKKKLLLLLNLTIIPTLIGCAVGPDYKKQEPWTPSKWPQTNQQISGKASSQVVMTQVNPEWWQCFQDPILSDLEKRLVTANLDVQMATQRLIASRAQLMVAGADRFPTLGGTGLYSRTQYSSQSLRRGLRDASRKEPILGDVVNPNDVGIPPFNQWGDALDTSWEIDLWGRVRREYESAHALEQVSIEDRRAVLIAQQAELAVDYITLRNLQSELQIVRENQIIAEKSLELAKQRYTGGLVTELDVQSATAQLEQTKSEIPTLEQQIVEYMNALGLLLGQPPRSLVNELTSVKPIPPVPPQVPVGIPSELAQRRPDIREAEAKLHSATADVGVAVANFYPKVTVDARLGFQSLSFKDLGMWGARAWNVGPTISIPIFEGGRLKGQLNLKKAQQKEAAISYQKTVLKAWQEIDNVLTAYHAEQVKNQGLQNTVKANQKAVYLAQEQYKQGLQTFINVLDAERRLLDSQRSLVDSTAQISVNLVQLYKALGGGWETSFPESSKIKNAQTFVKK